MPEKEPNSNPVIIPQSYPLKAIKEKRESNRPVPRQVVYLIVGWITEGEKTYPLAVQESEKHGDFSPSTPVKLRGEVRYFIPTQWIEDVNR
ncbi:hypothetical protein [Planobispora rosea]|nr:hypothetical protein [Planobispora rosea]